MNKITDLGSPDRELSARDIKRKEDKLRRTQKKLEKNLSARRRHNLEFKVLKTKDQIDTGLSGIRPIKSPLGFTLPYNTIKGVKNVADQAIDAHWKAEEKGYAKKFGKGNTMLDSSYAVYDRGRRIKFGPGQGKGDQGPKGAFEYDTPRLRTKHEDNPGDDKTHSYMSWKNRNK